jgi:uncharacterized protein (DUF2336 family)
MESFRVADPMTSNLTQADVAKLLAEPSPLVRAELAGKLAVELDSPRLSESELSIAQDIVRVMAKDIETSVRQALSQSLRKATKLPHDVALKLANDIESVALPILSHSQILTDEDLTAIVKSGAASKQEAIAARSTVSEKVSEALIETAGEKAVATLMGNTGAKINDTSLNKAVDRFAKSDLVKERMVKRSALPITVTERLVTMVSENLKEYLVTHHELSPSMASDMVMQSRERTIVSMSSGSTEVDLEKLIMQMYQNKRLTPSLVLRALCMGDIAFFETAVAVMANVPLVNARILIHHGGRLGLKSIYEKTGMPPRFLPAVRVAIDVVRETPLDGGANDRERYRARVIERVLTQYEDFGAEDLDYLLDKLGDVLHVAA